MRTYSSGKIVLESVLPKLDFQIMKIDNRGSLASSSLASSIRGFSVQSCNHPLRVCSIIHFNQPTRDQSKSEPFVMSITTRYSCIHSFEIQNTYDFHLANNNTPRQTHFYLSPRFSSILSLISFGAISGEDFDGVIIEFYFEFIFILPATCCNGSSLRLSCHLNCCMLFSIDGQTHISQMTGGEEEKK